MNTLPKVKFRFHAGSLEESMNSVIEVSSKPELLERIKHHFYPAAVSYIHLEYTVFDIRIGWSTYNVICECEDGTSFVAGMTNGILV